MRDCFLSHSCIDHQQTIFDHKCSNQYQSILINQTYKAQISPARLGSEAQQPNQCPLKKSWEQCKTSTGHWTCWCLWREGKDVFQTFLEDRSWWSWCTESRQLFHREGHKGDMSLQPLWPWPRHTQCSLCDFKAHELQICESRRRNFNQKLFPRFQADFVGFVSIPKSSTGNQRDICSPASNSRWGGILICLDLASV